MPLLLAAMCLCGQQTSPTGAAVEKVRQFVDPTLMVSGVDYSFGFTTTPADFQTYSHTIAPFWSFTDSQAVWADIPIVRVASPDARPQTGVGDVSFSWGAVLRENLERRLTNVIVTFDVQAPSGDSSRKLGTGRWRFSPGAGVAVNPTDYFPVIIIGRYLHSAGGQERVKVRAAQVEVSTIHILPKDFWLSALPSFTAGTHERLFTLGVGGGRTLTRRIAVDAAYVQRVAGDRVLSRGFTVSLHFILPTEERRGGG